MCQWDRLVSVVRNDNLAAVIMAPFLVASFLTYQLEIILAENPGDVARRANWKVFTH
jgi:hypothetical protein